MGDTCQLHDRYGMVTGVSAVICSSPGLFLDANTSNNFSNFSSTSGGLFLSPTQPVPKLKRYSTTNTTTEHRIKSQLETRSYYKEQLQSYGVCFPSNLDKTYNFNYSAFWKKFETWYCWFNRDFYAILTIFGLFSAIFQKSFLTVFSDFLTIFSVFELFFNF